MFPEPWVRKLCGRCVRRDRTPQLCILIDCGFSNGLRLWQREASLMMGELIGSLARFHPGLVCRVLLPPSGCWLRVAAVGPQLTPQPSSL